MTRATLDVDLTPRARALFGESLRNLHVDTDRLFARLMVLQWLFGVICAVWISPRTWQGPASETHVHVWAAMILGGLLALPPIWLARRRPGSALTRLVIAISQTLFSALLIHLTGGRIETHFHVFGSLAFLAFYRCQRTIIIATLIVALDHLLRGIFWPESVFGISGASSYRWLEHVGWVVFEDVVLLLSIRRGLAELRLSASRRAELEETNASIEEVVVERTRELESARDDALAGTRAKSEFLANMSHEIRTPMNGVLGFVHLLRETELTTTQRQYVGTIESSGEALLTIMNDILDFSKIEAGALDLELIPFSPEEVMETVSQLLSAAAAGKGLEIVCRTTAVAGLAFVGDPTRLQQVLVNLTANAIKFTAEGEVELDAHIVGREGEVTTIEFSVRDTGIGIPADRLDSLFNAFEQVDGSITRRFGGTGLGLTISQSLSAMMGGGLEVESELGVGSRFTATVRLAPTTAPSGERPRLDGRRLLVVDDNSTNRRLLEEALTSVGARVVACESALEALERLDGEPAFDAALLDHQMPDIDGLELARRIRARDDHRGLPLVLLSSDVHRAPDVLERLGILWHQSKPVRISALVSQLAMTFRGERPEKQPAARPVENVSPDVRLRVLLAEDNPVNQRLGRAMVERLGHEVVVAEDGLAAVSEFRRGAFDLVLMDAQMPELDGLGAAQQIRRLEEESGAAPVRIVAVTAHAMTGYRDKCLENGMDDYISKPIDPRELARVVEEAIARLEPVPET